MKTDKIQLKQAIEEIKKKIASVEKEINKPNVYKHFPVEGDKYYFHTPTGFICDSFADSDNVKVNVYQTYKEAVAASNKAVAVEKVNRRLLELQGDWKPNWNDTTESKFYIVFENGRNKFNIVEWFTSKIFCPIYVIKNNSISKQIITEMNIELKIIFDV